MSIPVLTSPRRGTASAVCRRAERSQGLRYVAVMRAPSARTGRSQRVERPSLSFVAIILFLLTLLIAVAGYLAQAAYRWSAAADKVEELVAPPGFTATTVPNGCSDRGRRCFASAHPPAESVGELKHAMLAAGFSLVDTSDIQAECARTGKPTEMCLFYARAYGVDVTGRTSFATSDMTSGSLIYVTVTNDDQLE